MRLKGIGEAEYVGLLERHPEAGVFHRPGWLAAARAAYGCELSYVGFFSGDSLRGGFPLYARRALGIKLYGSPLPQLGTPICVPLLLPPGEEPQALDALSGWVREQRLPFFQATCARAPERLPPGAQLEVRDNVEVDLSPALEDLWNNVRGKSRTSIRHAVRSALKVHWIRSAGALERYRELLDSTYARQGLRPNFPHRLYAALHHMQGEAGLRLLAATLQGRIVAMLWILHDARKAYFWDGASDQALRQLAANNLLNWEAIRWAKRRGLRTYDMVGRAVESGRSGARPGIGRFKQSLGAKPVDYYILTWSQPWFRLLRASYRSVLRLRNRPRPEGGGND